MLCHCVDRNVENRAREKDIKVLVASTRAQEDVLVGYCYLLRLEVATVIRVRGRFSHRPIMTDDAAGKEVSCRSSLQVSNRLLLHPLI
jgi:hypothetical protein